jgi:hypothetical protein
MFQDLYSSYQLLGDMDDDRRISIAGTLQRYRETLLQHNLAILRILVDGGEEQSDPEGWAKRDAHERRLDVNANEHLHCKLPESVSVPRDLLPGDVQAELILECDLNRISLNL